MNKYFGSFSFTFFGLCIVFSAFTISSALKEMTYNQQPDNTSIIQEANEWELVVVNENNIILFNSYTGEYWNKFIESSEGPTDWKKVSPPLQ